MSWEKRRDVTQTKWGRALTGIKISQSTIQSPLFDLLKIFLVPWY